MNLRGIFARAVREVHHVAHARTPTHARLRDRLLVLTVVTASVALICSVLAYVFEHGHRGTQIDTFGSAVFWVTTQLLTVSSQLPNPVSTTGRILDVVMEVYAVTVVATLAGSMGAFLLRRGEELDRRREAGGPHESI